MQIRRRPKSWLNLRDRSVEVRDDSSAAETPGFHALISGGFADEEIHFAVWGIPFGWPSIVILSIALISEMS